MTSRASAPNLRLPCTTRTKTYTPRYTLSFSLLKGCNKRKTNEEKAHARAHISDFSSSMPLVSFLRFDASLTSKCCALTSSIKQLKDSGVTIPRAIQGEFFETPRVLKAYPGTILRLCKLSSENGQPQCRWVGRIKRNLLKRCPGRPLKSKVAKVNLVTVCNLCFCPGVWIEIGD